MTKTFTDENGDKWEENPNVINLVNKYGNFKLIRPLPPQPEYEVQLYQSGLEGWERCIDVTLNCSETNAKAIKAAIEALLKYIYPKNTIPYISPTDIIELADEARDLITKEQK